MSHGTTSVLRCSVCQRELPADAAACPEHGATVVEVDPLLERIVSRRYRLVRCVGRGGMGAVYEGRHIHTDQRVAVKVLAPQLSRDLKLVARFRREAMATSRLRHENCVQVHDFGEDDDGTFFIAMELVDGRGIGDEIRRTGPVPAVRVARVGVQLLGALEAAHSAGILHRDLKPQNIMLTQKVGRPDFVKVVDFGIAKFVENSPEDQVALTLPGTIFGTPEYMSPEQARGETLDGRSDLYSAAVVLWHMLLGRSPYRGKTIRETLLKVFREDPPRPSEERPSAGVPRGLEDALLVALAKEARDRYPDAGAFRRALLPFVDEPARVEATAVLPGKSADGQAPATVGMDAPAPASSAERPRSGTLLTHAAVVEPPPSSPAPSPPPPPGATEPHVPIGQEPSDPERTERTAPATAPYDPPAGALTTDEGGGPAAPDAPTAPLDAAPDDADAAATAPDAETQDPVTTVASLDEARARSRAAEAEAPPARRRRASSFSTLTLLLLVVGGGALGGLGLGAAAYGIYRAVTGPSSSEAAGEHGSDRARAQANAGDRGQGSDGASPTTDGGWVPLEGFPGNAPARAPHEALREASAALAGEDLDAAAAAYDEALRADPSNAAALQGLALVAYRRGDLVSAKRHLEELMRLDERHAKQFRGFHAIVSKKLEAQSR